MFVRACGEGGMGCGLWGQVWIEGGRRIGWGGGGHRCGSRGEGVGSVGGGGGDRCGCKGDEASLGVGEG